MQQQLAQSQASLAELSEQLPNKQNELEMVIRERDEKLMKVMDQFAEKEEELEDLRKNNEEMKSQLKQLSNDVSSTTFESSSNINNQHQQSCEFITTLLHVPLLSKLGAVYCT